MALMFLHIQIIILFDKILKVTVVGIGYSFEAALTYPLMEHFLQLLILLGDEPIQSTRSDAFRDTATKLIEEIGDFEYFGGGKLIP